MNAATQEIQMPGPERSALQELFPAGPEASGVTPLPKRPSTLQSYTPLRDVGRLPGRLDFSGMTTPAELSYGVEKLGRAIESTPVPLRIGPLVIPASAGGIRDMANIAADWYVDEKKAESAGIVLPGTPDSRLLARAATLPLKWQERFATWGQGPGVEFGSYVNTVYKFTYGVDLPETGLNLRNGVDPWILAAGIAGDIALDPMMYFGGVGALGTKGRALEKAATVFRELGIVDKAEQTVETLADLGKVKIWREGLPLGRLELTKEYKLLRGIQAERGGTLALGTAAEQARSGLRGAFNTLRLNVGGEKVYPGLLSRVTGGRLSQEWVPIGGRVIAPILQRIETKYGITDFWTLYDAISKGNRQTRNVRRMFYDLQKGAQAADRAAGYGRNKLFGELEKNLNALYDDPKAQEDLMNAFDAEVGAEKGTMQRMLNDLMEGRSKATGGVGPPEGYRPGTTMAAEGMSDLERQELEDVQHYKFAEGAPARQRIVPGPQEGYREPLATVTPLPGIGPAELPKVIPGPEEFLEGTTARLRTAKGPIITAVPLNWKYPDPLDDITHAGLRDLVSEYRSRYGYMLTAERAEGLKAAELDPKLDPIDMLKIVGDENATNEQITEYVAHRMTPEARELGKEQGWFDKTDTGWGFKSNDRFLRTWTDTQKTRKYPQSLENFNDMFRTKYAEKIKAHGLDPEKFNFFESDPAKTVVGRQWATDNRIIAAQYVKGLRDHLFAYPEYRHDMTKEVPKDWITLHDMLMEASPNTLRNFNAETRSSFKTVILPDLPDIRATLKRSMEVRIDPAMQSSLFRTAKYTTDWWKANTLGAWPSYHAGNAVSDIYLDFVLGGQWDPTMRWLAAKTQKGTFKDTDTVTSWFTGKTYTGRELNEMFAKYKVDQGMYATNFTESMNKVGSILPSYYDFELKFKDRPMAWVIDRVGGTLVALTGIDPRIKGVAREKILSMLLPGGSEAIVNKVGATVQGWCEGNARRGTFLHQLLNEGLDPASAGAMVDRVHMNYAKDTPLKQALTVSVPFYEFTTQNTFWHAIALTQTPSRISVPLRLYNQTYQTAFGNLHRETLPEWMRGNLVFHVGKDKVVDLSRFIPLEQATEFMNVGLNRFLTINPFVQQIAGQMMNKDPFTGREVEHVPGEKQTVKLEWLPESLKYTEMSSRLAFVFRGLFRAFSEFERGDEMRTFLGLNILDENMGKRLHAQAGAIRMQMAAHERMLDPTLLVGRNVNPQVNIDAAVKWLEGATVKLITTQALAFNEGKDSNGNPMIPFASTTISYTDASGRPRREWNNPSAYGTLDEIGNLIEGPNGMIDLINLDSTLDDETRQQQLALWHGIYKENLDWRVAFLRELGATQPNPDGADRTRGFFEAELAKLRAGEPRETEMPEEELVRHLKEAKRGQSPYAQQEMKLLDQAMSDLDTAIKDDQYPADFKVFAYQQYVDILNYRRMNGLVPGGYRGGPEAWWRVRYRSFCDRNKIRITETVGEPEGTEGE
jgi:hypothetical protein